MVYKDKKGKIPIKVDDLGVLLLWKHPNSLVKRTNLYTSSGAHGTMRCSMDCQGEAKKKDSEVGEQNWIDDVCERYRIV